MLRLKLETSIRYEKSSLNGYDNKEVEVEVGAEEMYIDIQLGALGAQDLILEYAAGQGQCFLVQGGAWPLFSYTL